MEGGLSIPNAMAPLGRWCKVQCLSTDIEPSCSHTTENETEGAVESERCGPAGGMIAGRGATCSHIERGMCSLLEPTRGVRRVSPVGGVGLQEGQHGAWLVLAQQPHVQLAAALLRHERPVHRRRSACTVAGGARIQRRQRLRRRAACALGVAALRHLQCALQGASATLLFQEVIGD